MGDLAALAYGPVPAMPPVGVVDGWQVSVRESHAALRLSDESPLGTVAVRAAPAGAVAAHVGVSMGRAARRADGALVVGLAPGEWYVLTDPGRPAAVAAELTAALADVDELVTVLDLTHGRALLRLTGADAPRTLAKVCAIDLADDMTPDGAVLRTSVAALVTDVVRDDRRGARSYLLGCEWSSARYLWETVLHAGAEYGIDVTGFGR